MRVREHLHTSPPSGIVDDDELDRVLAGVHGHGAEVVLDRLPMRRRLQRVHLTGGQLAVEVNDDVAGGELPVRIDRAIDIRANEQPQLVVDSDRGTRTSRA